MFDTEEIYEAAFMDELEKIAKFDALTPKHEGKYDDLDYIEKVVGLERKYNITDPRGDNTKTKYRDLESHYKKNSTNKKWKQAYINRG